MEILLPKWQHSGSSGKLELSSHLIAPSDLFLYFHDFELHPFVNPNLFFGWNFELQDGYLFGHILKVGPVILSQNSCFFLLDLMAQDEKLLISNYSL